MLLCVVRCGSFKIGDHFVCGGLHGRIKTIYGCEATLREEVEFAKPGMMVEVSIANKRLKLTKAPPLGETMFLLDVKKVEEISEQRLLIEEYSSTIMEHGLLIENKDHEINNQDNQDNQENQEDDEQDVRYIVVKTDSAAALSTVSEMIDEANHEDSDIHHQLIHCGIGDMTQNDIDMASITGNTVVLYSNLEILKS